MEINDLIDKIKNKVSKKELYETCKALRDQGISSEVILEKIDEYEELAESSNEDSEYLDDIISALVGDCHSSCSLSDVHYKVKKQ